MKTTMAMLVLTVAATVAQAAALDQATYDAAVARAASSNRPVVVVAAAPSWEESSIGLLAAIAAPAMEGFLATEAVAIKLDPSVAGADPDARPFAAVQLENLGIHEIPSLTVLEANGAELGRIAFEAQTPEQLKSELASMVQGRRGWQQRLARLFTEGPEARLADAAHLLRHAVPVLGKSLIPVAEVVFSLDKNDSTGLRADAGLVVASAQSAWSDAAAEYLESIAANDSQKRFGFVMFNKSAQTLNRLMALQKDVKAGKAEASELRKVASELLAQVGKARAHAPNDDVRGQLMVRAALAFKIAGEPAKAESALASAKALAARFAATPEGQAAIANASGANKGQQLAAR